MFTAVARVNSLMKVLNYKLKKAGYNTPIKAGLSGSGINDVVYMGDVVNHAAKLASKGNNGRDVRPIFFSNNFVGNLSDDATKGYCHKDLMNDCYTAAVVNTAMNDWYEANCT